MSQPPASIGQPPAVDGQGGPAPRQQSKRLQQTQAQVDEVVGIMKVNVEKVLERDAKLSQLDDRADALQEGASQFERSAATLKRKYWWKNLKMMIIMGAIVLVIIIIIVVWSTSGGSSTPAPSPGSASVQNQPANPPIEKPTGGGSPPA